MSINRYCRELSIDMVFHNGISKKKKNTLFPCFTFIPTLSKRNLWIFKSGGWNFYSLPGNVFSKYFSGKFSKKLLKLSNFCDNLQEKYFEISQLGSEKKIQSLDLKIQRFRFNSKIGVSFYSVRVLQMNSQRRKRKTKAALFYKSMERGRTFQNFRFNVWIKEGEDEVLLLYNPKVTVVKV